MTNRKFKDYQKNRLAFIAISRNYELLCTILLTLNKEFPKQFYSKRCIEWIDTYAESCKTANEQDRDGVLDFKLEQGVKRCSIDVDKINAFVARRCSDFSKDNKTVLAANVKLALIQTAEQFGVGAKRMQRLQEALLAERIAKPAEEVSKFGIENYVEETNVGQVDYRKFQYKEKTKVTLQEQKEARAGLEAFRRWTQENVPQNIETE